MYYRYVWAEAGFILLISGRSVAFTLALKAGRGKLGQEASVAQILQDDMICTEILC